MIVEKCLRIPPADLIYTQKTRKQFNYKGLDFIYWDIYIYLLEYIYINVCVCVCVCGVCSCLPNGTVHNKVGFEKLCSKHNQKVTEYETAIKGK